MYTSLDISTKVQELKFKKVNKVRDKSFRRKKFLTQNRRVFSLSEICLKHPRFTVRCCLTGHLCRLFEYFLSTQVIHVIIKFLKIFRSFCRCCCCLINPDYKSKSNKRQDMTIITEEGGVIEVCEVSKCQITCHQNVISTETIVSSSLT